jgi:hypothetical protein
MLSFLTAYIINIINNTFNASHIIVNYYYETNISYNELKNLGSSPAISLNGIQEKDLNENSYENVNKHLNDYDQEKVNSSYESGLLFGGAIVLLLGIILMGIRIKYLRQN